MRTAVVKELFDDDTVDTGGGNGTASGGEGNNVTKEKLDNDLLGRTKKWRRLRDP